MRRLEGAQLGQRSVALRVKRRVVMCCVQVEQFEDEDEGI